MSMTSVITVFLFATALAGGIGVSMARSWFFLIVILIAELTFAVTVPACRGYEKTWEFVLFCGTMIPVHVLWFYPDAASMLVYDAYGYATVFIYFYCLFSVEVLLIIYLTHSIADFLRKK